MNGSPSAESSRPPFRLRVRIVLLVSGFSVAMFILVALGGLLVVLEAEDAILEANLDRALIYVDETKGVASPSWYEAFDDEVALQERLGLTELPTMAGVHELFASDSGDQVIWVHDWSSRWAMWRADDLEQEFRLLVAETGTSPRFRLVNLSYFEFTETRVEAIQQSILGAAAITGLAALLLSYLIARGTLFPVLKLAEAVNRRQHEGNGVKLASAFSRDEIGFLAEALDDAEARAQAALERERRFISDCSHELRTPVATLKSALTLVDELNDDPVHRAKVEARMRRAVDRMERLVQLFLVLAREGRQPLPDGAVALHQIITEVVDEQAMLHLPRTISTQIEVPPELVVMGRRDVVLVLVQNFVANVWRHAGGNRLRFQWMAGHILQIDDNGAGFPESRQGLAERADSAGFGVGLGLAERLCATQGWRIRRGKSDLGGARIEIEFKPVGG